LPDQRSRKRLAIALVLGGLAVALSLYSRQVPFGPGDLEIEPWFQSFSGPVLVSIMALISYLFSGWPLTIMVIVVCLLVARSWSWLDAITLALAAVLSTLDSVFKLAVNRPRPSAALVQVFAHETGKGFPSGHAMASILILGFLLYLIVAHVHGRALKVISWIFFPLLIITIGSARIFLGVHWPSDVIGGYLIGAVFLIILIWFHDRQSGHSVPRR
jgi:undecaprenyl-diphosphatase